MGETTQTGESHRSATSAVNIYHTNKHRVLRKDHQPDTSH